MSTFNGQLYAVTLKEGPPHASVSGEKTTPALKSGAPTAGVSGERATAKTG
jgi:uncharacterized protein YodC (DUF2158 family)